MLNTANITVGAAKADGMLTLRDDGWLNVLSGNTSVDEVARVTKRDLVEGLAVQ